MDGLVERGRESTLRASVIVVVQLHRSPAASAMISTNETDRQPRIAEGHSAAAMSAANTTAMCTIGIVIAAVTCLDRPKGTEGRGGRQRG